MKYKFVINEDSGDYRVFIIIGLIAMTLHKFLGTGFIGLFLILFALISNTTMEQTSP